MEDNVKARLKTETVLFPEGTEITLEPLTGGLSNALFLVNKQYVYRQYLDGTVPQVAQDIANHLSHSGFCPRTIRVFEDARLEEYLPLKPPSHQNFLGRVHKYIPLIREVHSTKLSQLPSLMLYPNPIFSRLVSWLSTPEQLANVPVSARAFARKCLQMWLDGEKLGKFKQCLCHNDLHHGNFLNTQTIIDFEFAGLNYELYDWANFANELELIPGEIEYVHQPNQLVNPLVLQLSGACMDDLLFFRNVSHLFWGCWALQKISQNVPVSFDYQKYSELRFSLIVQ